MPLLKNKTVMLSIPLKSAESENGIESEFDLCFSQETGQFMVLRTDTTICSVAGIQMKVFEEDVYDHADLITSKLRELGFSVISN